MITKGKIPKIIHQTWKRKIDLPICIKDNMKKWKELNPNYKYKFYDDDDCKKILYDNFGINGVLSFNILKPGAFKADLFRYAILYAKGGVYADVDIKPLKPLRRIIKNNYDLVSVNERWFLKKPVYGIWQAFLCCKEKCKYMKLIVEKIIDNVFKRYYPECTKGYNNMLSITGPVLLKKIIDDNYDKNIQIKLYEFDQKKNNRIIDTNGKYLLIDKDDRKKWKKIYTGPNEMRFENFFSKKISIYNSKIEELKNIITYDSSGTIFKYLPNIVSLYDFHDVKEFSKNKISICLKDKNIIIEIFDTFVKRREAYKCNLVIRNI